MSTFSELIEQMRESLKAKGSLDMVHLALRNHGFVEGDRVRAAIDEFEKRGIGVLAGQEPLNALEVLGVMLLTESLPHTDAQLARERQIAKSKPVI